MSLTDDLKRLTDARDFVALGNLFVEVLARPHQEHNPDEDALKLEGALPAILERKYGIPPGIGYPCVYRDQHIAHNQRGSWAEDTFVHLFIMAYMIGATRVNLPPPLDQLVCYFRLTAVSQEALLRQVAAECADKSDHSLFAARVAKIQAEYKRRKSLLPGLGLDPSTLERLEEAEENRFRDAILRLGDTQEFNYG